MKNNITYDTDIIDVLVVGGGPAGMAAACAAKKRGAERVLIIERDKVLGGILNQCIHNGFGLHRFKEELTGPEYAWRYIDEVDALGIPYLLKTTVLGVRGQGAGVRDNVGMDSNSFESVGGDPSGAPKDKPKNMNMDIGGAPDGSPPTENEYSNPSVLPTSYFLLPTSSDTPHSSLLLPNSRITNPESRTPNPEPRIAVSAVNAQLGPLTLAARAVVLCCGCRERPRGAVSIPGTRPSGVYTAGAAQKYVNELGYKVGERVVILGSGDIGLIMARRMRFEGAQVLAVVEIMQHSSGLNRNIVQCLDDFGIPLLLSHTVTQIHGYPKLTGVTVSKVDEKWQPVPGLEQFFECDTLLLSVGLIPENELSKIAGAVLSPITGGPVVSSRMETSVPGIFACGNMLHVHDLVDYVSEEAELAGRCAADYAKYCRGDGGIVFEESRKYNMVDTTVPPTIFIESGAGIRYIVPQKLEIDITKNEKRETKNAGVVFEYSHTAPDPEPRAPNPDSVTLRFRVDKIYRNACIKVSAGGEFLSRRKKTVLLPAEMEAFTLSPADLEAVRQSGALKIEVEE